MSDSGEDVRAAVEAEREACARLAETFMGFTGAGYCDLTDPNCKRSMMHDYGRGGCDARRGIAQAIRERTLDASRIDRVTN